MKIFKYSILIIILFSLGCKKDQDNAITITTPFFLDSSPTRGVSPVSFLSCDNIEFPIDTAVYCEFIQGEQLLLTEVTKYWVPQYQFDIGEKFNYKNENGQTLEFTLTTKENLLVQRLQVKPGGNCKENPDKQIGYCQEVEIFYVILENQATGINLYVEMGMTVIAPLNGDEFIQGEISIWQLVPDGFAGGRRLWDEEFDKTQELFMISNFEEEKILLNQTFQNVLNNGPYFYNKELGLIAFKDADDVLWVLDN